MRMSTQSTLGRGPALRFDDMDGQGKDPSTIAGFGGLFGGLLAAGGVAIVAVLLLRSMAEWKAGGIRRR